MSLLGELKRRKVFRVATAYVVAAWLVVQVVETIFPAFGFGAEAVRVTVIVLAIGFIPAVVLAWAFQITPQGLRRDSGPTAVPVDVISGRRLDRLILVLLTLAVGYFAFDKFVLDPVRERNQAAVARQEGRSDAEVDTYGENSIAVLPFANLSSDPEQEYFSDGVTEEILNLLARVPGLRVISRTSAFSYRGRNVNVAEIARELGVRYVLEGSVRRAGDRVRIATQLIEAPSDRHLWSESYERGLEDIFAVQDEIAGAVLPAIQHQLTGQPPIAPRTDPAAYSLYLQALHFFLQRTSAGLDLALDHVQRAIDIDPDYAADWTLLASIYINQVNAGKRPRDEGYRLATEAVRRALELAPDFAYGYSARAWIAMAYEGELRGAADNFRTALRLAPNSAVILGNATILAVRLGRLDDALHMTDRAIELDPVNSVLYGNRADQLIRLGRLAEAEQSARKALALQPGSSYARSSLALAQLLQEQPTEALQTDESIENEAVRLVIEALAQFDRSEQGAADEALATLRAQHAHDSAYFIAIAYAWRGEVEEAFDWLSRAIDEGQSTFGIRTEPFLRVLHDDPRWEQTLERVGLADSQIEGITL